MIVRTDKSLTSSYKELESITYAGNAYIDTGFIPSFSNGFKIEIEFTLSAQGYRYCLLSNYNSTYHISLEVKADNKARIYFNGGAVDQAIGTCTTGRNKVIYTYSSGTWSIDCNGTTKTGSYAIPANEPNTSMYMFVDRALRYSTFNHNLTIYSCKIWSNGQLVKHYVGAEQVSNGAIGMCNLLTSSFCTKGGSGNFISNGLKIPRVFKTSIPRLPNEYQEVEYITFTGAQCIRTGVSELVHPYSVTTIYNKTNTEATDQCLVGQRQIGKFSNLYNHYYESAYGNTASGSLIENAKTVLCMKSGVGVIVNTKTILATTSTSTVSTSYELLIGSFSEADYTGAKWFYKGYIYEIRIISGGNMIRHYIPCYRKSDNVYGLYDLINKTFNTTTTSTALSGGNEVSNDIKCKVCGVSPFGYTRVSYIQADGNQWVEIPTSYECDYFEFTAQYNNTSSEQCIVGNMDGGSSNRFELFCDASRPYFNLWTSYNSQGTTVSNRSALLKTKVSYSYTENKMITEGGDDVSKTLVIQPRYLFTYGGANYKANAKLFYYLEKKNGKIVMCLIPVIRNSDSKPGLYDTINKVFYTNQGTGDFTYGE